MKDCGVDDFNIVDIVKPEPGRLRRNLSAVIAFAQFREDRMHDYADLVNQCKQATSQFRLLEDEHEELITQIAELEEALKDSSEQAKQTQEHNAEVESELRKLKKVQEQLTTEHSNYKQEKQRLITNLENQSLLVVEARKENDRMKPYIVDSPEILQKLNSDLASSLQLTKNNVENMDRRFRALQISAETFKQIHQDLQACIKVIEECGVELQREQEASHKLGRFQEIYDQLRQDDKDLDIRISQLQRQIANSQDRIERARKQAEIKRASAEKKMSELREMHGTLAAERSLQMKEMDEKRDYIKSTELQISTMKEHIESEMRAIAAESEKLRDHLHLYLNSMEQRMMVR
ncbi:Nuf2p [Sugiyamaella lignohabitans]|uniref:Nuf2p n=1 Tax=Sugiyamaella lignohabitans TaxID=796027 RepID=A0A161HIZ5_9ASCO|nr:Nuf2p [Sugiyamaella lignohabitans]ANB12597.1 Nuf2p [Sugiyamaella lignohabitans]